MRQDRWLCLRFTHLALNSHDLAADGNVACVITDQQQLFQCNQVATQAGLRAGMSINHALMLNPDIKMLARDKTLEQQKLIELSHWAYRFTSQVCIYKEDTLMLEVGKSINLFNGLKHLSNLINHDLISFSMSTAQGVAATPKAAYVLSFNQSLNSQTMLAHRAKQLIYCDLATLDIEAKIIAQLLHCGFNTLADLEPIPKCELGQRFGVGLIRYLDQLWGRVADPLITTTPPETFESSADFAEPIRNLNWINQQLNRLLHDLEHFIKARQLICRSFVWRFYHENNRLLQTVTIGLSAKQNSFATFRELTDLKLANIKLDWEFASIELSSSQLVARTLFNDDLFDPRPEQEQFNQLIDKLSNRLGNHALFRVRVAPEHLPELANDRQPALQEICEQHASYQVDKQEAFKDQPLWLLENPQRLPQQYQQDRRNRPLLNGPLTIIHGPDRITSHWWSKIQSRDYFIARQQNGRLLWLFFDRDNKAWFLHGLFA